MDSNAAPSAHSEHLTFPTLLTDSSEPPAPAPSQTRTILKDRLFVGNIHPTVDEYTLLQIFSKFGKVTKLDFLFHKTGALKGKPRGYAFIEYGDQADALKALTKAHDKLLRGRKLVVTYAHQAPLDQEYSGVTALRLRKSVSEAGRPTTLSLIKSGMADKRQTRTEDKITLMEAKLKQLEGNDPSSSTTPIPSSLHPSLPPKPPPSFPKGIITERQNSHSPKPPPPLPSLPIKPSVSEPQTRLITPAQQTRSKPKLAGVRIMKPKDKKT